MSVFNTSQIIPPAASAVATGQENIAESLAQSAAHLRSHPTEMRVAADTMTGINKQLTDLAACATQSAENSERLREVVGESKKTAGWLSGSLPNADNGGRTQTFHVGNGAFNALWQRYG